MFLLVPTPSPQEKFLQTPMIIGYSITLVATTNQCCTTTLRPGISAPSEKASASGNALRMAMHCPNWFISFNNLHKMANRATPEMNCVYKLSLLFLGPIVKKYQRVNGLTWNLKMISQQQIFNIMKQNNLLVGLNVLCNRLHDLHG